MNDKTSEADEGLSKSDEEGVCGDEMSESDDEMRGLRASILTKNIADSEVLNEV